MTDCNVAEALKKTTKGRLSYEQDASILNLSNELSEASSVYSSRLGSRNSQEFINLSSNKENKSTNVINNGKNKTFEEKERKRESLKKRYSKQGLNQKSEVKSHEDSLNSSYTSSILDSSISRISLTDSLLSACDEEIDMKVKSFLLKKQQDIRRKETEHRINSLILENSLYERIRQKFALMEREEEDFNKALNEELKENQRNLKESHSRHAMFLDQKDSEAQKELIQKDALKKQKESEIYLQKIKDENVEILKSSNLLSQLLAQCEFPDYLPTPAQSCELIMKSIVDKITSLYPSSPSFRISNDDVLKAESLSAEAKKLISSISIQIVEANRIGAENLNKSKQKLSEDQVDLSKKCIENKPSTKNSSIDFSKTGIMENCRDKYLNLLQIFDDVESACKEFSESVEHKKYRYDLMGVIGRTVNVIHDEGDIKLKEKVHSLNQLLSGETIYTNGGQRISINNHPQAKLFCLSRLAKKLVNQGGELLSSNPVAAFSYASVVQGFWCLHPVFGDLFLAHLAVKCPFLVPYNVEKSGRSDVEYNRLLGYKIDDDGNSEIENSYLKRISGYFSLYAAVTISKHQINNFFPLNMKMVPVKTSHGLKEGWLWLANFLGQYPKEGIAPTALYSFLTIVGAEMFKYYGKQFYKLLMFIKIVYLPEIVKVTTEDGETAPIKRLQLFIDEALDRRFIANPRGL